MTNNINTGHGKSILVDTVEWINLQIPQYFNYKRTGRLFYLAIANYM